MPEMGTMQQINSEPLHMGTILTPQSQAEQYAREAQQAAAQAAQSATDAQSAAASAEQAVAGAVKYSDAQTLTAAQQAQARENIGAGDADAEDVTGLKSAINQGTIVISTVEETPFSGYWSRASNGQIGRAPSTSYYTVENPIDISELSVGTTLSVMASVTGNYGVFIADTYNNVLDYINGSNASERGYTPKSAPQLVTLTVPEHAKKIVADIRNTAYSDMSIFDVTGFKKTRIDDNAESSEYALEISDVISKNISNGYTYIYPYLEIGQITITTNPDTAWTYIDNKYGNYIRTKENFAIHLFPNDVVGFTDYSNGLRFHLGWRRGDSSYGRALENTADFSVTEEGDYVITFNRNPNIAYYSTYTDGSNLFIRRSTIKEKQYHRIDRVPIKGLGHRGYTYEGAPENTIWSFRAAKTKGFPCVETDVAWTSDGVAVLLHDPTINRTGRNADGTEIAETINITDITYAQALEYDFGIWKGSQYAGTKIMTVEELLIFCRATGLFPYFELKSGVGFSEARITEIINIVKKYDMLDSVSFISFSFGNLKAVSLIAPTVRLGRTYDNSFDDTIKNQLLLLKTPYNTVVYNAYLQSLLADIDTIVAWCAEHDIVLGIAMTNDANVMKTINNYVTEACSEVYVFGDVIADREMGL